MKIEFVEDSGGYASRTIKNASADVTLAFAIDFNTAGEKLTKKLVLEQGNLYIPISFDNCIGAENLKKEIYSVSKQIISLNKKEITLNIAGNGIYSFSNYRIRNQVVLDIFILCFLRELFYNFASLINVTQIRSGGQSGVDEAGAKAGIKLGIKTLVLAPKSWQFRDKDNNDIYNEKAFKSRFSNS